MSSGVQVFCVQAGIEFVMANRFMATPIFKKMNMWPTRPTPQKSWEKYGSPQYAVMLTAHTNALASGAGFWVHVQRLFPACSAMVLNVPRWRNYTVQISRKEWPTYIYTWIW